MMIERRRITVRVGDGGEGPIEIHEFEYDVPFEGRNSSGLGPVPSCDEVQEAPTPEVEEEQEEEQNEEVLPPPPARSGHFEVEDCFGAECLVYAVIGLIFFAALMLWLMSKSEETCDSETGRGISTSRIVDISEGECPINY